MWCSVFLSKEIKMDWESPSSSCEESPSPTRRRLCRMDALNPMSQSSCNSEVCVCIILLGLGNYQHFLNTDQVSCIKSWHQMLGLTLSLVHFFLDQIFADLHHDFDFSFIFSSISCTAACVKEWGWQWSIIFLLPTNTMKWPKPPLNWVYCLVLSV